MTRFRTAFFFAFTGLLVTLPPPVRAYEADDVRAIIMSRPAKVPAHTERLVLASQRKMDLQGPGELATVDHIIWMVGPAGPRDLGVMRWTQRIGVERIWMKEGWVHRAGGLREAIPPDSARTGPCAAAGPDGYPGIADFVVHPPPLASGDIVEVKIEGVIAPIFLPKHYVGEHHFGGPDSTIESELQFSFPTQLPLRTWWFGKVPPPEEKIMGAMVMARWLLGDLPPEPPCAWTISSCVSSSAPDSLGPPVLRYGFPDEWESIVQSHRRPWRLALRKMPQPLVDASGAIQNTHPDPADRLDAAVAWIRENLAPLEIPAARMWFAPADLIEVTARGAAIPRDRAAAMVWLLRSVGVPADAAMVCSGPPFVEEVALPQQLDTWIVLARPRNAAERWIDLRPDGARPPLPPGSALIWTSEEGDPILLPFPGTRGEDGN
jgi:hypothetical protein